jgi:hypothetical protein
MLNVGLSVDIRKRACVVRIDGCRVLVEQGVRNGLRSRRRCAILSREGWPEVSGQNNPAEGKNVASVRHERLLLHT